MYYWTSSQISYTNGFQNRTSRCWDKRSISGYSETCGKNMGVVEYYYVVVEPLHQRLINITEQNLRLWCLLSSRNVGICNTAVPQIVIFSLWFPNPWWALTPTFCEPFRRFGDLDRKEQQNDRLLDIYYLHYYIDLSDLSRTTLSHLIGLSDVVFKCTWLVWCVLLYLIGLTLFWSRPFILFCNLFWHSRLVYYSNNKTENNKVLIAYSRSIVPH